MTILEAMKEAYLLATGKSTLPDSGSTKYNRLYNLAVRWHREFIKLPEVDVESQHDIVSAGTVTATDEFELSLEIAKVSKRPGDRIYITTTGGADIEYKLVSASQLRTNRYGRAAAIKGQTIKFSRAFTSDDTEFGGEIFVPAFLPYDEISSVSDDVELEPLDWFTNSIARDYVAPDAQLNFRWDDLNEASNQALRAFLERDGGNETTQSDEDYFAAAIGGDC